MGDMGIGKGRGKFKPIDIQTLRSDINYEPLLFLIKPEILSIEKLPLPIINDHLTIKLENPLRFKENGKLLRSTPEFNLFIERLILRIGLLAHFHCGAAWPDHEIGTLLERNLIHIRESSVHLTDWRRYYGTQDTTMNFDGLTGQITYEGNELSSWLPIISLGCWLHAGSTATFGLGRYSIIIN
jgi:hypothetical protein